MLSFRAHLIKLQRTVTANASWSRARLDASMARVCI